MYQARVIADSVTEYGIRALTIEMRYPYSIHQDQLTYRSIGKSDDRKFDEWATQIGLYDEWLEFSRSSASNRALTMERIIQAVIDDPVIPVWRKATVGMTPGDIIRNPDARKITEAWLNLRDIVIEELKDIKKHYNVHKSQLNRALAPWQEITTVFTANEQHWLHYFKERAHSSADPLLQPVAYLAQEAYKKSEPVYLRLGEWHLPFVELGGNDLCLLRRELVELSAARAARSSYLNQWKDTSIEEDLALFKRLVVREDGNTEPVHAAPTEHQLQAATPNTRSGNVYGFNQFRKLLGL